MNLWTQLFPWSSQLNVVDFKASFSSSHSKTIQRNRFTYATENSLTVFIRLGSRGTSQKKLTVIILDFLWEVICSENLVLHKFFILMRNYSLMPLHINDFICMTKDPNQDKCPCVSRPQEVHHKKLSQRSYSNLSCSTLLHTWNCSSEIHRYKAQ